MKKTFKYHSSVNLAVWFVCFVFFTWSIWWNHLNLFPDGYQNEYLHVGNAFDLWTAFRDGDLWHLRWYFYTYYWPSGTYAASWPWIYVFGMSYQTLIASNIVWFVLLLASVQGISRITEHPLAMVLCIFCPAVYGGLVRYEPNLANMAWTVAGLYCLLRSDSFRHQKWVLGWAACLGFGLLSDRLTVAFFLFPAALPCVWNSRREPLFLRRVLEAFALILLITFAYYREFFLRHYDEIFQQVPLGEIDSSGELTEPNVGFRPFYYLWVILDTQAGPAIGLVLVLGWVERIREWFKTRVSLHHQVLLFASLPALLFFTLLAKKQVYYTIPALIPLILLTKANRLMWVGAIGGFVGWLHLGVGIGNFGGPWLPEKLVAPRHILVRPPSHIDWSLDELTNVIHSPEGEIHVLSSDETLFEGYLVLKLRESFQLSPVRGVILDPMGSREFWHEASYFIWMSTTDSEWPTQESIENELLKDHYLLKELPPIAKKISQSKDKFQLVEHFSVETGRLWVYKRVHPSNYQDP